MNESRFYKKGCLGPIAVMVNYFNLKKKLSVKFYQINEVQ